MDMSMMVTPDIASMSMASATSKFQSDVSVAMLSKNLDTMQSSGAALTKMMELSVNPAVGGNFDMSV